LGPVAGAQQTIKNLATPFGFLEQIQTGFLLTRPLLCHLKNFFITKRCYRLADVDYPDIQLLPTLRWQDIFPKQIIFCEGYHAAYNPWFSWLPFQLVKGEILTLDHQNQMPDNILNFGNWLIPLNSHRFRIGATHDRKNLDNQPTERGKTELSNALKSISVDPEQATLINHQANIRPCTLDKQPFVGHHPQYPQLAIFNGFGAKGSLQIPWYSRHFVDSLLSKKTAITSNIQRFYATHFTG
jgi:glycine/D-amino acid oxidase-like deaminating enzyme